MVSRSQGSMPQLPMPTIAGQSNVRVAGDSNRKFDGRNDTRPTTPFPTRGRRWRGEIFCAESSRQRSVHEKTVPRQPHRQRISNFVSKKMCVLEIDLEIVEALPDKADKRKNVLISNSPSFFLPAADEVVFSTHLAYARLLVGISVGIYRYDSPRGLLQPSDMNSVGGPETLQSFTSFATRTPSRLDVRFFIANFHQLPPVETTLDLALFWGFAKYPCPRRHQHLALTDLKAARPSPPRSNRCFITAADCCY